MKKLKISKVWIAMTVVVIIAVAVWALSGGKEKEEINFKQEKVSLQTLQNSVTATGTIEAVTSVSPWVHRYQVLSTNSTLTTTAR